VAMHLLRRALLEHSGDQPIGTSKTVSEQR
jgi:hypothetical protein